MRSRTKFPTGIIYVWDSTGLTSGTRPLTGVRLWDAGVLPSGGLVVGSNDPIYLKGDFNTGSTLPAGATADRFGGTHGGDQYLDSRVRLIVNARIFEYCGGRIV